MEDEESSARYDPGSGYLTVTLTKETKGQEFKDLDLLAKLLAPRPTRDAVQEHTIEVLSTQDEDVQPENDSDDEAEVELVAKTEALSLDLDRERQEILKGKISEMPDVHHILNATQLPKMTGNYLKKSPNIFLPSIYRRRNSMGSLKCTPGTSSTSLT